MKINKETRQLSKELLRASFTDGRLDSGRIASLVKSLIEKNLLRFTAIFVIFVETIFNNCQYRIVKLNHRQKT